MFAALKDLTLKAAAFFSDVTFDTLHCDLHMYSPMLEKQVTTHWMGGERVLNFCASVRSEVN